VSVESTEAENDADFIDAAYELLLTRKPTAAERDISMKLLNEQRTLFAGAPASGPEPTLDDGSRPSSDAEMRARESLCHALLNHHDFISIR
jgi:hypothetical protein